jgi:glucose-1-phosphate cytidylyltransferase
MVEIGGTPVLLHIMNHYSNFGVTDFIICVGYKGYQIKEFFANLQLHTSDFTIEVATGKITLGQPNSKKWKISVIDTGVETMTGGRLKRVSHLLHGTFFLTYGDGLSTVDIREQLSFHKEKGKQATILAVRPPSRFAVLDVDQNSFVRSFREKPEDEVGWINGGYFVLEKSVLSLIKGDATLWEQEPLQILSSTGELRAFRHTGFWYAMDTLRDKRYLESLWESKQGPWQNDLDSAAKDSG